MEGISTVFQELARAQIQSESASESVSQSEIDSDCDADPDPEAEREDSAPTPPINKTRGLAVSIAVSIAAGLIHLVASALSKPPTDLASAEANAVCRAKPATNR